MRRTKWAGKACRVLATACIGVWLMQATKVLAQENKQQSRKPKTLAASSSLFGFDGERLIYAYGKDVYLYRVSDGKRLQKFIGHGEEVHAVAFSPSGMQVLTGSGGTEQMTGPSKDNSARLWDVASGKEIRRFEGHTSFVHTVQFGPGGKQILTAGRDSTARVWNVETGQEMFVLRLVAYWPPAATFSPDGLAVLGLTGRSVTVWDAKSGERTCRIEIPGNRRPFKAAEFSPNGELVLTASGHNTAGLWDARTGRRVREFAGHTDHVNLTAFTDNGKKVITGSRDGSCRVWNASTGKEIRRFLHPGAVREIILTSDGTHFICRWDEEDVVSTPDGISLWNAETGKEIMRTDLGKIVRIIGFTPDGSKFLVMKAPNEFVFYSTETGTPIAQLTAAR